MRLVFLGTAAFAVPSLRVCAESHDVAAVVTQPDRPGHRGGPAARPVADAARSLGLQILTPERIRDEDATREIAALSPRCIVVAAYGQILSQALLDVPPDGAVNVHASLLPRWRGASPVAHAIMAGDTETGVTIMRVEAGLDTGPIYALQRVAMAPDVTAPSLTATLAQLGARLLGDVLQRIERGDARATAQPDHGVTLAPRLRREDGMIEWETHDAVDIDRRVRALQPWPGVMAPLGGQRVRILEGHVASEVRSATAPGGITESEGDAVTVATSRGSYGVARVLPPGSRPMSAAAYLRGRR
ncbi:MAG: methionyl-tRNA formyltransferase [Candidatus Dormibacteria bacterium]